MNWKRWKLKTKFQISNLFVARAEGSGLKPSFKFRAWSRQILNVDLMKVFPSVIGIWGMSKILGLGIPLACFKMRLIQLITLDLQHCLTGLNEKRVKAIIFKNLRNANNGILPGRNWRVKDLHLLCTSANTMEMKVTDSKLNHPTMKQLRKRPRHKYGAWLKSNDSY